jgi:hypothetical protein
VNIKNGGTELNHETVIITSNHHPAAWYRKLFADDPKQWNPVARRLSQVFFFPTKREDGQDNIPDENHGPYYIDQTDTFLDKEFQRNYDLALAHAEQFWPIPKMIDDIVPSSNKRQKTDYDNFLSYAATGH